MKKRMIFFTLALVFVFAGVCAVAAAPKTTSAIKGTPSMMDDAGNTDPIWAKANMISVDTVATLIPSEATSRGKVWTMWDENFLYVLAEVTKNPVNYQGFSDENADTIEFDVDFLNSKGIDNVPGPANGPFEGFITSGAFRVNADGTFKGLGEAYEQNKDKIQGKWVLTATGYKSQISIPWSGFTPSEGAVISFEAQINDNGAGNGRDGLVTWNDPGCLGYKDSAVHGELTLAAAPVVDTGNTGGGGTGNTQTGDFGAILFVILAALSAAGVFALRRKASVR